jgi:single-strand DNA-binding protein
MRESCILPGSRPLAVPAARPKSETPFRRDLFRSAIGLLDPVASIHNTGGAKMRKNKTNATAKQMVSVTKSQGGSVTQVTLIGRLVATPELGETASGKDVTTVRVATNAKSHAEFHDVVLWGQLADFATNYLGKGRLVYVEGRLQSRQWQATDGSTRRSVEIVANRLQAHSSKSVSEAPAP